MSDKKYNLAHQEVLDEILLKQPDIVRGRVFGLACYKIYGKVFATLYGDGVGIKLPADRAYELKSLPHISEFRPYNKSRGKSFIQINREISTDYTADIDLLLESADYVANRGK